MLELAITQGALFVAFTRNATAIELPDGTTVLGPLSPTALPLTAGAYVIRAVTLDGPPPGPLELGGTQPPMVEGECVVVRRTATPLPAEAVAALQAQETEAAWTALRTERDRRLKTATALLDRHRNQRDFGLPTTLPEDTATAWAIHAQALRDLPEHTPDPTTPAWPPEPTP